MRRLLGMAIAIPVAVANNRTSQQARTAAQWTTISAGVALLGAIPLLMMLVGPVSELLFVRGGRYNGDWGKAFTLVTILIAPATYAFFFGTAGEVLKSRVAPHVHKTTMRVAAVGFLPYIAMIAIGLTWTTGPQESFLLAAALTIPIGMVATIWASTQNH